MDIIQAMFYFILSITNFILFKKQYGAYIQQLLSIVFLIMAIGKIIMAIIACCFKNFYSIAELVFVIFTIISYEIVFVTFYRYKKSIDILNKLDKK